MKSKPYFDLKKCYKCKYHGEGISGGYSIKLANSHFVTVYCNYADITGKTCLAIDEETGELYDRRGTNSKKCKFFEEGKKLKSKNNFIGEI